MLKTFKTLHGRSIGKITALSMKTKLFRMHDTTCSAFSSNLYVIIRQENRLSISLGVL